MPMYAHSNPQHPEEYALWEPLYSANDGHLDRVAERCAVFASEAFKFIGHDNGCWQTLGRLTGFWHDLGKFSDDFQCYLKQATGVDAHTSEVIGRVDHTSAGAQHAVECLPPGIGALLAYPIAGHHAGLLDGLGTGTCLKARLTKTVPQWKQQAPADLLKPPTIPPCNLPNNPFAIAFATRMLFSCLVDADFLATESFMNPEQSAQRRSENIEFSQLDTLLHDYLAKRFGKTASEVAQARTDVLSACLQAAEGKLGLYSLTVPTGGGKTLSSLAFALRHATRNGLRRVIYAIPFTSIIEQTAQTFRDVFTSAGEGYDDLILEHHSNFDPEEETVRSRLASENWDSQLIVTTNVQLFESLFASRTSRCRKLHRIASSVIILDEAQTLPIQFLEPCLKVLRLLVEQYGCTVVLCTATQPAIEYRDDFTIGLPEAFPIIGDAPGLYRRLKRVQVKDAGTLNCAALTERLAASNQVLAIVSTRRHASDIYQALVKICAAGGSFHLSAAMTPEHRSEQLEDIRKRLREGKTCRVVATQLIEAGVDVDFPEVWRSLAGLDSIAQAAGRCNREGKLEQATTWVFKPADDEHPIPPGFLRRSADAARQIIATGRYTDLLDLPAIEHYFRLHYWEHQGQWDRAKITAQFQLANDRQLPLYFNFATVAENFQFIDSPQLPVIVARNEKYRELVERLRRIESAGQPAPRSIVRQLQRCTVTVNERAWRAALGRGDLQLLYDRFTVLAAPQLHYHEKLGLQLDADPLYDPNDTII